MPDITITINVPDGSSVGVAEVGRGISVEPRSSTQSGPADPWDTETPETRQSPAASRTEPSRANSEPPRQVTDSKHRVWTFNADNAPRCECSEPAVRVKGSTNGKSWEQWRCAKDFDDYKRKCKFSQFVDD